MSYGWWLFSFWGERALPQLWYVSPCCINVEALLGVYLEPRDDYRLAKRRHLLSAMHISALTYPLQYYFGM